MAMLVNRERLYERTMSEDALAAWVGSLSAHILAAPINKTKERSKKKRKNWGLGRDVHCG